jgi:hypothetical protein
MKVLWFDTANDKVVDYDPNDSEKVYKWILWKDQDEKEDHLIIASAGGWGMSEHKEIVEKFKKCVPELIPDRIPDGAGSCDQGFAVYWDSAGYDIFTDIKDRPMVVEALGLEADLG